MKKITLSILAVAALSLASCKKDRVCTCTYTSTSGIVSTTKTTMFKVKKAEAHENCIGTVTTSEVAGVTSTGGTSKCELK